MKGQYAKIMTKISIRKMNLDYVLGINGDLDIMAICMILEYYPVTKRMNR